MIFRGFSFCSNPQSAQNIETAGTQEGAIKITQYFLVKPDVETGVAFLKMVDFEIVDQNIRKDGA